MPTELLNLLVQLPLVAAFVWYSERMNNRAQDKLEQMTLQFMVFLKEERNIRETQFDRVGLALSELKEEVQRHDQLVRSSVVKALENQQHNK
jgi:hypothetical protein